jgi:hypothetical protein
MDAGAEPIADSAELARVRRQARAVYLKSLVATAALTGVAFLI